MAPVNKPQRRSSASVPKGTRQSGFSLIELMVSVLLGMIVVGAAIAVYISMIFSAADTVRMVRLNHDMGSLLLFMTNDIRRAGYWGAAVTGSDPLLNPFTKNEENIQILPDWDGLGNPCIVYTYDADADGLLETEERFGFRLNADDTISLRMGGTPLASCLDDDGTWENITVQDDSEVVAISDLQFSFIALPADTDGSDGAGPYPAQPQTSLCDNLGDAVTAPDPTPDCTGGVADAPIVGDAVVARRLLNVRITGQSGRDQEISRSLSATVKVANDRLWVVEP